MCCMNYNVNPSVTSAVAVGDVHTLAMREPRYVVIERLALSVGMCKV
jgi:hypothetical protein